MSKEFVTGGGEVRRGNVTVNEEMARKREGSERESKMKISALKCQRVCSLIELGY